MISVFCNIEKYEYDIRALVMGFFPGEELEYHIREVVLGQIDNNELEESEATIDIELQKRDMSVSITSGDNTTCMHDVSAESLGDKIYRDDLKRLLYSTLSKHLDRDLAWGTLTGVRPTKIPMQMLMRGISKDNIINSMMDEYYLSERKARLCTEVADTELRILNKVNYNNGYSVYIGIPFCPTVCTYCSFSSTAVDNIPGAEKLMEEYITALEKECRAVKDIYSDRKLTSIYVGGGTPTALNEELLSRLMSIIAECFDTTTVHEFTVEAGRPDSINEEKLRILKEGGVTRISVNPQTMKQQTLACIGRRHTVKQVIEAFELARKIGFDDINMDLIAGLQGETVEDFDRTLEYIDKLQPDSFTVHSLVVKRASAYRQQKEQERGNTGYSDSNSGGNVVDSMLDNAARYAYGAGYIPYYMYRQKNKAGLGDNPVLENVGYSKPGKEGVYNILIMEEKQTIIALGAGASSKIVYNNSTDDNIDYRIERIANVKNVREYIDRIDEMIERKKR